MGASKILSLQNGGASFIKRLFAAPLHFVGRYILPGCLISIFFWVWILLECLDPEPQKRHHFVGTCCSAISLRFSQLSLRNPSFLYGSGCNDMCGVFFLQCWQKVKRSYPFFCPRVELCWKARLTRTSGMPLHFEILVVATLFICNSTTIISKCNAMPLVRVSLAFQHNSTLGQKKGYERFTFCQHCKKKHAAHIIAPTSVQKGWVP